MKPIYFSGILVLALIGILFLSGCVFQANQTGIYGGLTPGEENQTETNIWCGDGMCNGQETPQTCSIDCQATNNTG